MNPYLAYLIPMFITAATGAGVGGAVTADPITAAGGGLFGALAGLFGKYVEDKASKKKKPKR